MNTSATPESNFTHLESIFLKTPFIDTTRNVINKQEDVELDIGSVHTYTHIVSSFLVFLL